MVSKIRELNSSKFDDFIGKGVSVIDFWASWCGPCRMMNPIFQEAAESVAGAKFGKVNVDESSDLAQRFQVMSIPTLIFLKDGEQVERAVGLLSKEEIVQKIKSIK